MTTEKDKAKDDFQHIYYAVHR